MAEVKQKEKKKETRGRKRKVNKLEEENLSDDGLAVVVREDDEDIGLCYLEDGSQEWAVERIYDKKEKNGIVYYRVKWYGWKHKYDTWEPENNLTHCKKEVKAFEERLKEKEAQGKVTVTTPPSDEGTSTSLCEQITDDESSEEDDCVFDAQLYQNLEQWGSAYPCVRFKWDPKEKPICILGSCPMFGELYHMVRIKSDKDPEDILENPYQGLNDDTYSKLIVIVSSQVFRKYYPVMLAKHYMNEIEFTENGKSEDNLAETVARQSLLKNLMSGKVPVNYRKMYNDMLPEGQGESGEAVKADPKGRSLVDGLKNFGKILKLDGSSSSSKVVETVENEEQEKMDDFGLPEFDFDAAGYIETIEDDDKEEKKDSGSESEVEYLAAP